MIPDLLGYIFGVDIVEMTIKAAMGVPFDYYYNNPQKYYATHNLHTNKNGRFLGVDFAPEIEKYIIKKIIYKKAGDDIEFFDNASKAIGIVFFKFDDQNIIGKMLGHINEYICVNCMEAISC